MSDKAGTHIFVVKGEDDYELTCGDPDCTADEYYVRSGSLCQFEDEDLYEKVWERVPEEHQTDYYVLKPGEYTLNLESEGDVDDEGRGVRYVIVTFKEYKPA
jgi:hypothetical protein